MPCWPIREVLTTPGCSALVPALQMVHSIGDSLWESNNKGVSWAEPAAGLDACHVTTCAWMAAHSLLLAWLLMPAATHSLLCWLRAHTLSSPAAAAAAAASRSAQKLYKHMIEEKQ